MVSPVLSSVSAGGHTSFPIPHCSSPWQREEEEEEEEEEDPSK